MYIMSSGKIGMVLTYRKKNIIPITQPLLTAPVPPTAPLTNAQPSIQTQITNKPKPRFFPSMNHFTNNSMKSVMHNPNKGCSSCGS
jgi:hypothetical protein